MPVLVDKNSVSPLDGSNWCPSAEVTIFLKCNGIHRNRLSQLQGGRGHLRGMRM
jgi:hypothetical protein